MEIGLGRLTDTERSPQSPRFGSYGLAEHRKDGRKKRTGVAALDTPLLTSILCFPHSSVSLSYSFDLTWLLATDLSCIRVHAHLSVYFAFSQFAFLIRAAWP